MGKAMNQEVPVLLSVGGVASMLGAGERTVWRLHDTGKMPRAIRIGGLVKWPKRTIELWLADGAPDVRRTNWTPPAEGAAAGSTKGGCQHA